MLICKPAHARADALGTTATIPPAADVDAVVDEELGTSATMSPVADVVADDDEDDEALGAATIMPPAADVIAAADEDDDALGTAGIIAVESAPAAPPAGTAVDVAEPAEPTAVLAEEDGISTVMEPANVWVDASTGVLVAVAAAGKVSVDVDVEPVSVVLGAEPALTAPLACSLLMVVVVSLETEVQADEPSGQDCAWTSPRPVRSLFSVLFELRMSCANCCSLTPRSTKMYAGPAVMMSCSWSTRSDERSGWELLVMITATGPVMPSGTMHWSMAREMAVVAPPVSMLQNSVCLAAASMASDLNVSSVPAPKLPVFVTAKLAVGVTPRSHPEMKEPAMESTC